MNNQIILDAIAIEIKKYQKIHKRYKPRMLVMRSNIRKKLFGKQKTKTILGYKMRIITDDAIREFWMGDDKFESNIYLY